MIVKSVKLEEIPSKRTGCRSERNIVKDTVENFIKSPVNNIEVIDDEGRWSNSNNFRKSFQNYLKNNCITEVTAIIRGDRVFLIKG